MAVFVPKFQTKDDIVVFEEARNLFDLKCRVCDIPVAMPEEALLQPIVGINFLQDGEHRSRGIFVDFEQLVQVGIGRCLYDEPSHYN
ncbi:hypothetical protein LMA00_07990 [Burkholderia ambifaria]|uniref:hypothetical protein n=1 Tax=Burkholderia ambifaria TaxID=152480 RepID=UPI001E29BA4A|nr:hypothetical protein [Burkholderia ambifaria]UEP49677.1 hypothetical protein LMA00_07990 [Burkholderia ambifaria]